MKTFLNLNLAIVRLFGCFVGEHLIGELIDFMKGHWELVTKIMNLVLKSYYPKMVLLQSTSEI